MGFDPEDGINVMLYGQSGTGKTTLWGTFPGPTLAIVCSGGTRPGELRSIDTAENREKIQQVSLEKSTELSELVEYARGGTFKTIVLDHASGFYDLILAEILGVAELPAQKFWGMASQQQYGQATQQAKEHFKRLLGLSCNVVTVAHERVFGGTDESHTADMIRPVVGAALVPSLTTWLNGAVDYICQCYKRSPTVTTQTLVGPPGKQTVVNTTSKGKGVEYCLRVAPTDAHTVKFRVPKGGAPVEDIVDPSYDKLIALIRGQQET